MRTASLLIVLGLAGACSPTPPATLAERLGHPADARMLIIHADDLGLSSDVNRATFEAMETGMVTSASLMVPCPGFDNAAATIREHPDLDVGLHLTLTSEWQDYRWGPVAGADAVPGLVDPRGFLHRTVKKILKRATTTEIEQELRAQIELALANGIQPTHLDSHMAALYSSPEILETALNLGREYGIPFAMYSYTPEAHYDSTGALLYDEALVHSLREEGYPLIDAWLSMAGRAPHESMQAYKEMISALEPGLSILVVHVAPDNGELNRFAPQTVAQRSQDFKVFTSSEMKQHIRNEGIVLIGWRDLQKIWLEG